MSGYETSFADGEDEVIKSPQFQHDANDVAAAQGEPESETDVARGRQDPERRVD